MLQYKEPNNHQNNDWLATSCREKNKFQNAKTNFQNANPKPKIKQPNSKTWTSKCKIQNQKCKIQNTSSKIGGFWKSFVFFEHVQTFFFGMCSFLVGPFGALFFWHLQLFCLTICSYFFCICSYFFWPFAAIFFLHLQLFCCCFFFAVILWLIDGNSCHVFLLIVTISNW